VAHAARNNNLAPFALCLAGGVAVDAWDSIRRRRSIGRPFMEILKWLAKFCRYNPPLEQTDADFQKHASGLGNSRFAKWAWYCETGILLCDRRGTLERRRDVAREDGGTDSVKEVLRRFRRWFKVKRIPMPHIFCISIRRRNVFINTLLQQGEARFYNGRHKVFGPPVPRPLQSGHRRRRRPQVSPDGQHLHSLNPARPKLIQIGEQPLKSYPWSSYPLYPQRLAHRLLWCVGSGAGHPGLSEKDGKGYEAYWKAGFWSLASQRGRKDLEESGKNCGVGVPGRSEISGATGAAVWKMWWPGKSANRTAVPPGKPMMKARRAN